MADAYLLLNHEITKAQRLELTEGWGAQRVQHLDQEIGRHWSAVSPYGELDLEFLKGVCRTIEGKARKGDMIVVQGEYGATFFVVNFCLQHNFVPLYATSLRNYEERQNADGSVERFHRFRHIRFRRYMRGTE
jgi:hypothetical protein